MREVCAVITKGTMIDGDMVTSSSEASIILSVTERPLDSDSSMIGLCVVDASTSCFQLGQVLELSLAGPLLFKNCI